MSVGTRRQKSEAPERHAELCLSGFSVRQLTEDCDAEEELGDAEHDEAMAGAEEWPIAVEV